MNRKKLMHIGMATILVISVFAAFTAVASADDFPCNCGDICVNETGWWRDGGAFNASSTPIQHAIDNAIAGDSIYVYNGSYAENVNKQLTLQGEGRDVVTVTTATSERDHVFEVTADYVNISGFTMTGASYQLWPHPAGIYLGNNIDHRNISNNNASDNDYGIHLYLSSSNNILMNNIASNNSRRGISTCGIRTTTSSRTTMHRTTTMASSWRDLREQQHADKQHRYIERVRHLLKFFEQ